jgi:hypothetical protein
MVMVMRACWHEHGHGYGHVHASVGGQATARVNVAQLIVRPHEFVVLKRVDRWRVVWQERRGVVHSAELNQVRKKKLIFDLLWCGVVDILLFFIIKSTLINGKSNVKKIMIQRSLS